MPRVPLRFNLAITIDKVASSSRPEGAWVAARSPGKPRPDRYSDDVLLVEVSALAAHCAPGTVARRYLARRSSS
jgi:hypothetical protein